MYALSHTHNHANVFAYVDTSRKLALNIALLASFHCTTAAGSQNWQKRVAVPRPEDFHKLLWSFQHLSTNLNFSLSTSASTEYKIVHTRLCKLSGMMWCAEDCQGMQDGGLGWIRTAWVPSLDDLDARVKIMHESVFMKWTARTCGELFFIDGCLPSFRRISAACGISGCNDLVWHSL